MNKRRLILLCRVAIPAACFLFACGRQLRDSARRDGFTSAAWAGDTESVRAYLDAGMPTDTHDGRGQTALQTAIIGKHPDTMRLLLDRGADPSDALSTAVFFSENGAALLPILFAHGAKAASPAGDRAFMTAVANSNIPAVNVLLAHGANVNASDTQENAIQKAASNGDWDVFRILVAHGADLRIRSHSGETPLMLAASFPKAGSIAICRYLLQHGAKIDAVDDEDRRH